MASAELDPLFVKSLRLLHSTSKDSADQLKQLLDDAILQSKQSKDRGLTSIKLESDSKVLLKKASSREAADIGSKHIMEEPRERKLEKRPFEKTKQESTESLHEAKIPKLEFSPSFPQVFSYYPPSPDLPKLEQFAPRRDEESDSSDENADADDFAMEMGLACVICKQLDVTQGNQLIECQECHCLYHQECHKPPATDHDVNDPRRVWYCAKCMKNMKKMASKPQKSTKSSISITIKEPVAQAKCPKVETPPPVTMLPFKRTELKAPISQSNNQSSANKPIGLAGLAANLSGRVTTAASSTSQSSRNTSSKSSSSTLKSFSTFSSQVASSKTTTGTSSSVPKSSSSSPFSSLLAASTSVSSAPTSISTSSVGSKPTTSSPAKATLVGMSSAVTSASGQTASSSAANRNAGSSNNGSGSHMSKSASCSPLMNADKRVQIMKKKAAKLQEKRRLSTK